MLVHECKNCGVNVDQDDYVRDDYDSYFCSERCLQRYQMHVRDSADNTIYDLSVENRMGRDVSK